MCEAREHGLDAVLAAAGDDAVPVDAERLGELGGAVDEVERIEQREVEARPAAHVPQRPPLATRAEPACAHACCLPRQACVIGHGRMMCIAQAQRQVQEGSTPAATWAGTSGTRICSTAAKQASAL